MPPYLLPTTSCVAPSSNSLFPPTHSQTISMAEEYKCAKFGLKIDGVDLKPLIHSDSCEELVCTKCNPA